MKVQHFFDSDTSTLSYVVFDEFTKDAVVIDPVLDFDPHSGFVEKRSVQLIIDFIHENHLNPHFFLETHVHADHLSSSQYLKLTFPSARIGISRRITQVQNHFKHVFNQTGFLADGSDFDFLFEDNVRFQAGSLNILPIPTPGHTPACSSLLIGDCLFSGDALLMPDAGTGRCDFPLGSAQELYQSIKRLYDLPGNIIVLVGHDYQPNGRLLKFQTTIGESKLLNQQLNEKTLESDYVDFRNNRDKTLKSPRLLLPSLQVNMRAGHLPQVESNNVSYLKIPLTLK